MNKDPKMHYGHFKRVRQKAMNMDPYDFEETLAVETVLQCIFQRADTNEIAKRLIAKFGNFAHLAESATPRDLTKIEGIGQNSAEKLCALLRVMYAFRLAPCNSLAPATLGFYHETLHIVEKQFEGLKHEKLVMFLLNKNGQIVGAEKLGEGDHDHVIINKHMLLQSARNSHATSVVLAHNHTNNSMHPSIQDVQVTSEICRILATQNIQLKDHIIVSNRGVFSFEASHLLRAIKERINGHNPTALPTKNPFI